jgi:23S rRNA (adenine-N6)-dimethyltransferase
VAGRSGPWGFHELSRRWAARLVELAAVEPGNLVVDVGAGNGAITNELVRAGASVVAVELHPRRAAILRQRFAGAPVKVVRTDAVDLRFPRQPFKIVANPPFDITTALLRRSTAPSSQLTGAAIVLPTWATMRWAAGRGVGGMTSKHRFAFTAGPRVPAHALRPPPHKSPHVLLITRTPYS